MMHSLGQLHGINIKVDLDHPPVKVDLNDLPKCVKKSIMEKGKVKKQNLMDNWLSDDADDYHLPKKEYDRLASLQDSVLKNRSVDDRTYLRYILRGHVKDALKEIAKEYGLRGYSSLNKDALIDYIADSLSEEELFYLIEEIEPDIINLEFSRAIRILTRHEKAKERLTSVELKKPNEVEISFEGFNWETTAFLALEDEDLEDPLRDCSCRIGADGGFCAHFWTCFIILWKKEKICVNDWNLTQLPSRFKEIATQLPVRV